MLRPPLFPFQQGQKLIYTERGVDQSKNPEWITANDLDRGLDEATSGQEISVPITNPIGCNV